jgi:putative colanic acid biosynthesis acetyltransferase WcaF
MTAPLDAATSRPFEGGASFSLGNRIERFVWGVTWLLLARWNPRGLLRGWRRLLLRAFGASIGPKSVIYPDTKVWLPRYLVMGRSAALGPGVDCYNMAPISIGDYVVVSQRAFLCAGNHDHRDPDLQLITAPVVIGARAWIAAEAFVGPGVTVGEGAVLAARGCAARDLEPWSVYAGNPAKLVAKRELRN